MKRKTVSLCMLTLNNEHSIGLTIKSALALADEVIVVDLGSKDTTRIAAEGYGARVIDFDFNDDYSAARNAALDTTSCDWILWLNPDEYLMPIQPRTFQNILTANAIAYKINIRTENSNNNIPPKKELRLFRYHPTVRYYYPVREQIESSLRLWQSGTSFDDAEYSNVLEICCDANVKVITPSPHRIVSLLNKGIEDDPWDPYLEYALACEYFVEIEGEIVPTYQLPTCFNALQRAWNKSLALSTGERKYADYLIDLTCKLSACHLASGRVSEAWQVISTAKEVYPRHHLIALQYTIAGISYLQNIVKDNKSPEAKKWAEKLLAVINYLGEFKIRPAQLAKHLGDLMLFMGDIPKAQTCFERSLSLNGQYSYAWLGLAQCHLYLGDKNEAIKCYMAAIQANENNCAAWLEGSKLLEEIGFSDNAAIWQEKITSKFPYFLKSLECT